METKRARTTYSEDKPNGKDVELATEANLDTRKRFIKTFLSYECNIYVKVMVVSSYFKK